MIITPTLTKLETYKNKEKKPTTEEITAIALPSIKETKTSNNQPDTYNEITRRIGALKTIEDTMSQLSDEAYNQFLPLVKNGNIKEIIKIENYPFLALRALKEEKLSQDDFATIVMPWSSQDTEKQCYNLLSKEPEEKEITRIFLEQTFKMGDGDILSDDQINHFLQELEKLPSIQHNFWIEFNPIEKKSLREGIKSVYKGLNVFSRITNESVIIPSAGMMQTFLKIKFLENAVRMNFVLGLSSIEDIENNGRNSARDAALRFPGVDLPDTADGYSALGTDFTYHDFFHAINTSIVPHETRAMIVDVAASIKEMHPSLYESLVDLVIPVSSMEIINKNMKINPLKEFIEFLFYAVFETKTSPLSTIHITGIVAQKILQKPKLYLKEPLQLLIFFARFLLLIILSFLGKSFEK
jgi:hypothetical protein